MYVKVSEYFRYTFQKNGVYKSFEKFFKSPPVILLVFLWTACEWVQLFFTGILYI